MLWLARASGALVAATFAAACTTHTPDPGPSCVTALTTSCAALYDPPVYQTIFDKILRPTCATGTGSCHTSDGAKGGLVLENADVAYGLLLGASGARARVKPGDPGCSLIMERLESADPAFHMPPGPDSLLPGERCTIVKWIALGAKR